MEENSESIAIGIIRHRIERCQHTIESHPGDENIGVRISAMAKIVMLQEIIKDIEYAVKRLAS
jgi:hypothetical protein